MNLRRCKILKGIQENNITALKWLILFVLFGAGSFFGMRFWLLGHHHSQCEFLDKLIDVGITALNYIGTILVANGVILVVKDVSDLQKNPAQPTKGIKRIIKVFLTGSGWARAGVAVLSLAFVLDISHRSFLIFAAANTCTGQQLG